MLGLFAPLGASSSSSSGFSLVIFLVLIFASFYFLLIRPQQRRARQQRTLIESVDIGDEVMTIGGIFGTVRAMDDESFTLEVAPGVDIRCVRSSIARKLVYDTEDYQDDDQDEDQDQDEEEEESAGDQP